MINSALKSHSECKTNKQNDKTDENVESKTNYAKGAYNIMA